MSLAEAAFLVLEDGSVWRGTGVGARGVALGELCFNTAMSGHQEVLSDPSYAEQIVVFSFPHIGNVGANAQDDEASSVHARGCVFAQRPSAPSNWRCEQDFSSWLCERGLVGLCDVDTRSLVRLLRDGGAQRAALVFEAKRFAPKAFLKKVRAWPGLKGAELAKGVSCREPHVWREPHSDPSPLPDPSPDPSSDPSSDPLALASQLSSPPSVHVVALGFC